MCAFSRVCPAQRSCAWWPTYPRGFPSRCLNCSCTTWKKWPGWRGTWSPSPDGADPQQSGATLSLTILLMLVSCGSGWCNCWCWGLNMMNSPTMKSSLKYIYLSIDGYRYKVALPCQMNNFWSTKNIFDGKLRTYSVDGRLTFAVSVITLY